MNILGSGVLKVVVLLRPGYLEKEGRLTKANPRPLRGGGKLTFFGVGFEVR